ncbi:MAG: COQ9 family protein [Rhodospirillaceae bacterium]|nr:COQ9 family protein [Rhodospirillaceae bacterium]
MSSKDAKRDAIVLATLTHVPFDGWTVEALQRGAADEGMTSADVDVLFPDRSRGVIRHWLQMADRQMLEDLADADLKSLRIRDRISLLVRTRLKRWAPHREAVRRALALSVLPGYSEDSLRGAYATVDAMWRAAGDRSTDFNFYTKRGLLAAIYSSTLLVWLDDRSEGCADTWAFLDRRIATVMKVPKAQSQVKEALSRLPNPLSLLRRSRRTA